MVCHFLFRTVINAALFRSDLWWCCQGRIQSHRQQTCWCSAVQWKYCPLLCFLKSSCDITPNSNVNYFLLSRGWYLTRSGWTERTSYMALLARRTCNLICFKVLCSHQFTSNNINLRLISIGTEQSLQVCYVVAKVNIHVLMTQWISRTCIDDMLVCWHPLWNGQTVKKRKAENKEISARIQIYVLYIGNSHRNNHTCSNKNMVIEHRTHTNDVPCTHKLHKLIHQPTHT